MFRITFTSPKLTSDVQLDAEPGVSLADIVRDVEASTGTAHNDEECHFSVNGQQIQDFYAPLVLRPGDRIVATWSKVGGSVGN